MADDEINAVVVALRAEIERQVNSPYPDEMFIVADDDGKMKLDGTLILEDVARAVIATLDDHRGTHRTIGSRPKMRTLAHRPVHTFTVRGSAGRGSVIVYDGEEFVVQHGTLDEATGIGTYHALRKADVEAMYAFDAPTEG